VAAEPAHLSTAVIEDRQTGRLQVVSVGDSVEGYDGVVVSAIEARRVLLQNGPRLEKLMLHRSIDRTRRGGEIAGSDGDPQAAPDRQRRLRSGAPSESQAPRYPAAEAQPSSPETLAEEREAEGDREDPEADAAPRYGEFLPVIGDDGDVTGLSIPPDQQPEMAQVGFENQDLITQVNGLDVADPASVTEIVTALATRGDLTIQLERGGESMTMQVPARDIGRQLLATWSP
jgi:type II secretory pathway component PulC